LNHSLFLFLTKMSGRRTRDSCGKIRGEDTVAAPFPRKGLRPYPRKARDSPEADILLYFGFIYPHSCNASAFFLY
jgi:hypothetical protein